MDRKKNQNSDSKVASALVKENTIDGQLGIVLSSILIVLLIPLLIKYQEESYIVATAIDSSQDLEISLMSVIDREPYSEVQGWQKTEGNWQLKNAGVELIMMHCIVFLI